VPKVSLHIRLTPKVLAAILLAILLLTDAQVLPPSALRLVNIVFLVESATVAKGRPDESVVRPTWMLSLPVDLTVLT